MTDADGDRSFGLPLDTREEAAYRLLAEFGAASAARLADVMRSTLPEIEGVLADLVGKGLVGESSSPGEFEPLAPDAALATSLLHQQESLDAARQMVSSLSETFRSARRRRDPRFVVEVVSGARALRETLRSLQDSATSEILWFCRANPLAMAGTENSEERGALERGVRYRAVYERALLEMPGELAGIREAIGWGEESRVVPELPVRLAIVDRSTAICPLLPDQDRGVAEPTAAVIGPGQLLDALLALFDSVWGGATPLDLSDPPGSAAAGDLLDGDRALLSLVVAGLPDKTISSLLEISRRTVQRRLFRLMAIAGVDSRAALAYQAARRGWV